MGEKSRSTLTSPTCFKWLRGAGGESRPVSEGLRSRRGAQGGARESRPCPGGAGVSPGPERPHGRLADRPRESTPGKRRRSRGSEAGPSGPRTPSSPAPGAVPALDSWRRRRPARSQRCRAVPFPRSRPPARSFLPPPPRAPLPAIARVPSAPVTHTAPDRGAPGPAGFCSQLRLGPSPAAPRPPPVPSQPRPSPCLSRQSLPPSAAFISYQLSFLAFLTSSFQTPGEIKTLPFPPKLLPGRPPPSRRRPGSPSRRPRRAPQKVLELKEDLKPVPAAPAEQQPLLPRSGSESAPPRGTLEFLAGTITSNEWSSPTSPEGSNDSGGSEALDKPIDNDAEGVWSPDIEQSFQEALAIYPPCGRRKIILSDEGKMYGRNELIARYIKLRTGKTRTRKQVSSHIQVLARRKAREIQAKLKDQAAKDKAMQSMATMSSAQIISATAFHSKMGLPGLPRPAYPAVSGFWQGPLPGQAGSSQDVKPFSQQPYAVQPPLPIPGFESPTGLSPSPSAPAWQGRRVASSKLWMLEFSAFLEQQQDQDTYNKHLFVHIGQSSPSYNDPYLEAVDIRQIYDKFPEKKGGLKELFERGPANAFFLVKFWADLNTNIEDESRSFYGVSSQYESPENMVITCSTKVCSFGKQVVEKVETEYARYENGHYSYRIHRSPLCEYMINFIHKLKHLPEKYMMNSVLENFTILQVVTNRDTQETLLCIAYVFEVSTSDHGAQHHIYRLVKD
ncbi:transcriptional enhancer factor TEF-3 [Vidua chalybeata]|nr:transcriptional enhancer factor TEF-3 [Vidua chalybeata]